MSTEEVAESDTTDAGHVAHHPEGTAGVASTGFGRFIVGDVRTALAKVATGSVDLIITSPPFYRLRSYLPDDHADKSAELGSEASPAEYIANLLALTAELRRVLAPHGSIAVELGDTYAGSGGAGGDYNSGGIREGQNGFRQERTGGHPLPKSLCFTPTLYAASLAYGVNLLTGEESPAGRWRVRNLVAWVRPNPPVGALGDKYRPATSFITIATIARDRWFDLDAVRSPNVAPDNRQAYARTAARARLGGDALQERQVSGNHPSGTPPLDWWHMTPAAYSGAHYAVFPPELPKRLIASMCPRRVCETCGAPSRRITEPTEAYAEFRRRANAGDQRITEWDAASGNRAQGLGGAEPADSPARGERVRTVGWSDCGHGAWRRGHVLDPFVGSGTTLVVATGMGRDGTGIDLDARNAELAAQRVGMFLTVEAS